MRYNSTSRSCSLGGGVGTPKGCISMHQCAHQDDATAHHGTDSHGESYPWIQFEMSRACKNNAYRNEDSDDYRSHALSSVSSSSSSSTNTTRPAAAGRHSASDQKVNSTTVPSPLTLPLARRGQAGPLAPACNPAQNRHTSPRWISSLASCFSSCVGEGDVTVRVGMDRRSCAP